MGQDLRMLNFKGIRILLLDDLVLLIQLEGINYIYLIRKIIHGSSYPMLAK